MTVPHNERVSFFVDGFNLYHSLCAAQRSALDQTFKWLDLEALFREHLDLVAQRSTLQDVWYFTAYAYHLARVNPGKISRHKAYIRALTARGTNVRESHFKQKQAWETKTGRHFLTHEEKETDVAIACLVLEGAARNEFDTAVLVTGDTDLRPVVETFQRLYRDKRLLFAFPFDRKNRELARIAPDSFSLSTDSYSRHQLPTQVRLPSGKFVRKPEEW